MGLHEKAGKMHQRVLLTGLSLDTSCTDWSRPNELLSAKPWFMQSKRAKEAERTEKDEEAQSRRQELLRELAPELKAMSDARAACKSADPEDPRPFLRHILEKHPPKLARISQENRELIAGSEAIKKTTFVKMQLAYSPDKLGMGATDREIMLATEIMTRLNDLYEVLYK